MASDRRLLGPSSRGTRVRGEQDSPGGVSMRARGDAAAATRATVERARVALRSLIELSGLSRREVEKRLLDLGGGTDLGRLLRGGLDLKLRHIVDILRVVEIYPLEFFRMVCENPPERSPLLGRLAALVLPTRIGAPADKRQARSEVEALERLLARLAEVMAEVEEALAPHRARRGVIPAKPVT
jgi:hypothetical protein